MNNLLPPFKTFAIAEGEDSQKKNTKWDLKKSISTPTVTETHAQSHFLRSTRPLSEAIFPMPKPAPNDKARSQKVDGISPLCIGERSYFHFNSFGYALTLCFYSQRSGRCTKDICSCARGDN
jgi:hypothetical protein